MSLNAQQKKFIDFYIKTGKPKESAIKAGYSPKSASSIARDLLTEHRGVMAEIQEIRDRKGQPRKAYDLQAAMDEADEAIVIAKETGNAAAFLAAVKLKAQLMKILDDKPAGSAFQINISGINDNGPKTVINVSQPNVKSLTGDDEDGSGETN